MFRHTDKDNQEVKALQLIDQAEKLVDLGKSKEAVQLYEKASQIYIDIGKYIKLDEVFARIIEIISQFKNKVQAIYRLKSIIRKTEELKLNEISAKMLVQLGNIYYKMKDWESAAENWRKAADYFYEIDPEIYYNLSSVLLLKSGEALERSHHKRDEGEILILKAIMRIDKFDKLYQDEEKKAISLLKMEEYEPSARKFLNISNFFRNAVDHIDDLINSDDSIDIIKNTKARFLHLTSEYQLLSLLIFRYLNDFKIDPILKQQFEEVSNFLRKAILLLKDVINSRMTDIDNEDFLRYSFDGLLLGIINDLLNKNEIISNGFLIENINDNYAVKKIQKAPYFKTLMQIEKAGISNTINKLRNLHLGHMDKVKEIIIHKLLSK